MRSAQSSLILFCSAISLCLDAPRAEAQNPREFKQDVAMSGRDVIQYVLYDQEAREAQLHARMLAANERATA